MKLNTNSSLKLISMFPLLLLVVWSTYFAYTSYNEYMSGIALQNKLVSNRVIKNLSLNLARERGLSATYYGSKGTLAIEALKKQRADTDKAISKFKQYFADKELDPTLDNIFKKINQIQTIRSKTDKLNISFDKMFFGYYSVVNALIIDEYKKILSDRLTPRISSYVGYEINLLSDMEKSGQERGFVSYVLATKKPFSFNEYKRWMSLFTRVNYAKMNLQLATQDIKSKLFSLFNSKNANSLYEKLIKAKIDIINGSINGDYKINPKDWFALMTQKIKLLNNADNIISKEIKNDIQTLFNTKTKPMFIVSIILFALSIILLIIGYFIDKYIRRSINELEKLFGKVGQLADIDEEIDFQTTEGIEKGYRIIEIAIDQIQQDKQVALEASRAKSIFLANMSHEIRTPLNGIIGFTELLKNTDISGEERDFVDIIEKSSENLLEIINNILDLSKIESDKIEVEEILFSPITEFENAVEVFGAKAAEKNIRLSFYMDPSLNGYLSGDPTKIKEVLINLLSNAIKFTPINGEIDVEIKREGNMDAFGRTKVYFAVTDNGIGISEDKLKTIFDAFSQADSTITRKYGGTGLGLTISSKFIALMGGELKVESKVGEGTKFYFTLEFDESPSSEANYHNKFLEYRCALLAGDSNKKNHTQYIYDYLKYFGCEVFLFKSSKEARGLIYRESLNFLILDVDYVGDDEIKEYQDLKIPGVIILKSSMQAISSKYTNDFIKSIYEPVNVTKLANTLEKQKALLPKAGSKQEDVAPAPQVQDVQPEVESEDDILEILVAEDNEINRKLIKRTLESYGAVVTLANNGKEALEQVKIKKYDLIFMDIAMPVMDGVEALHAILDFEISKGLKHTPIVALTANALKGDRERFLDEGFDEYVTKPIRGEKIELVLSMFLSDKYEKAKERAKNRQKGDKQDKKTQQLSQPVQKKHEIKDFIPDDSADVQKESPSQKLKIDLKPFDEESDKESEDIVEDVQKTQEDFSQQEEEVEEGFGSFEEDTKESDEIEESIDEKFEENDDVKSTIKPKNIEPGSKIKALTVEDNLINQKLIEKTLKNLGLEVDIANNGEEAVNKYKINKYDIVFMDISMPVMDGIEATHEILAYEKANNVEHTPIVALTANALPGDREAFLEEGLDEYISKPLKKEDIVRILKLFLNYQESDSSEVKESINEEPKEEPKEDVYAGLEEPVIDDEFEESYEYDEQDENEQEDEIVVDEVDFKEDLKENEPLKIFQDDDFEINQDNKVTEYSYEALDANEPKVEETHQETQESEDVYEVGDDKADIKIQNSQDDAPVKEKEIPTKDVLIFKNNKIESKILNNMIKKFGYDTQSVTGYDEFVDAINNSNYKIVMIDKDIEFVDSKEVISFVKDVSSKREVSSAIIEFVLLNDSDKNEDENEVDEIVDNVINKNKIKAILEKYI